MEGGVSECVCMCVSVHVPIQNTMRIVYERNMLVWLVFMYLCFNLYYWTLSVSLALKTFAAVFQVFTMSRSCVCVCFWPTVGISQFSVHWTGVRGHQSSPSSSPRLSLICFFLHPSSASSPAQSSAEPVWSCLESRSWQHHRVCYLSSACYTKAKTHNDSHSQNEHITPLANNTHTILLSVHPPMYTAMYTWIYTKTQIQLYLAKSCLRYYLHLKFVVTCFAFDVENCK